MGSRVGWIGLLLAAIAVSLWWFRGGEVGNKATAPEEFVIHSPGLTESTGRLATSPSPQQVVSTGASTIETSAETDAVAAGSNPFEENGTTWTLAGWVVEGDRSAPCPGFRVLGSPRIDVRCDLDGRFEVELDVAQDPPGCTRILHVYDTEGVRRATLSVRLIPGLGLRLESQNWLRGRVVDPAGVPVRAEFVVLRTGRGEELNLSVSVDDGSFQAPVPEGGLRSEMVELQFTVGPSVFSAVCSAVELMAPWGATVVLDLCDIRMRLRTSDGQPVRFASMWMESRRANAEPRSKHFRLRADAEGLVEMTLERDRKDISIVVSPDLWVTEPTADRPEVAMSLGGHANWIERRDRLPCGSVWDIPFHRLGVEDVLSGRVLRADGSPASEATVSCWGDGRPWSKVAVIESKFAEADADGRFSIAWPEGRPAQLRGGSDSLGWSRSLSAVGGDRGVELRLDPTRAVSVRFVEPDEPMPSYATGRLHYWLELEDGRVESHSGGITGLTLEHVPIGRHRLSVFAYVPPRFGVVELEVVEGRDLTAEVRLRSGRTAFGKVVDASGTPIHGVLVRLIDMHWPSDSFDSPFVVRTDLNGRFMIQIGDNDVAELELSRDDRPYVRVPVLADTPATWTLP